MLSIWPRHDDVIKGKHFLRYYWPFVRKIHRSPVNSPHKGQWRGALVFSLICAWINGWVNNRKAGDLRRHRAHFDDTVMSSMDWHQIGEKSDLNQWEPSSLTNIWVIGPPGVNMVLPKGVDKGVHLVPVFRILYRSSGNVYIHVHCCWTWYSIVKLLFTLHMPF